jgi:carbon monoxide dehydrogenase subunit G
MKLNGSHVVHAPRQQVWEALRDPAVLVRTIPGCQELAEIADDTYAARVRAGVASIKGIYDGRVAISDQDPPAFYTLRASGSGGPGTIDATAAIRLTEDSDGNTQIDYDADAVIGGAVGGVGQRVLAGVARRNATVFFGAVDRYLTEEPEPGGGDRQPQHVTDDGTMAAQERLRAVHRREPAPAVGADPALLLVAALAGAAVALLGVRVGRRVRR